MSNSCTENTILNFKLPIHKHHFTNSTNFGMNISDKCILQHEPSENYRNVIKKHCMVNAANGVSSMSVEKCTEKTINYQIIGPTEYHYLFIKEGAHYLSFQWAEQFCGLQIPQQPIMTFLPPERFFTKFSFILGPRSLTNDR